MSTTDRPPLYDESADTDCAPCPIEASIQRVIAEQRRYRRQHLYRRWRSLSWMAWLADTAPEDIYPEREFRRSAEQEASRQWLRAHSSWSFLGRYQTVFGMKLAASLPICVALIQVIPELRGRVPVHVFGWCYLAGLCWLIALLLYQWRSPRLLKASITAYAGLGGAPRRQLLCAFVEAEFDRLVHTRIWKLHGGMDLSQGMEKTAIGLLARGHTPVFEGFGPWEQALIERAIYEWAKREQAQVLEEVGGKLSNRGQRLRSYEGSHRPMVNHLYLRHPSTLEIESQPSFRLTDLILEWRQAPLQSLETREQLNRSMRRHYMVEGLARLFEYDAEAESMASIVAQWSNWRRPCSRTAITVLYALTLLSAGIFLFMQTRTILSTMLQ
jgi:hypothetical protein